MPASMSKGEISYQNIICKIMLIKLKWFSRCFPFEKGLYSINLYLNSFNIN